MSGKLQLLRSCSRADFKHSRRRSGAWSEVQRREEADDVRRPWIAHDGGAGDHPHVLEEDMAAELVAGQRLVRWDYERVALKADDVLVVRASADLLGLQLMLVGL